MERFLIDIDLGYVYATVGIIMMAYACYRMSQIKTDDIKDEFLTKLRTLEKMCEDNEVEIEQLKRQMREKPQSFRMAAKTRQKKS